MIVAVTGPTGDIGRALLRRLDAEPLVTKVLGMARRPFDPGSLGLEKTEYTQGDVLDRDAVHALAAEADVLVHLAFIIVGGREETRAINL
jgi:UDP-glucose 4-epimerase